MYGESFPARGKEDRREREDEAPHMVELSDTHEFCTTLSRERSVHEGRKARH